MVDENYRKYTRNFSLYLDSLDLNTVNQTKLLKEMRLLLLFNGDPDIQSFSDKKTALHVAAQLGNIELMDLLLSYNADINRADSNDWTALHYAANYNNNESVQFLLMHNADSKALNNKKQSALVLAIQQGNLASAELLALANSDVNAVDHEGNSPLHYAAVLEKSNAKKIVELLLLFGADINIKNKENKTPFMNSCSGPSSLVSDTLMLHGAEVTFDFLLPQARQDFFLRDIENIKKGKKKISALLNWPYPLHRIIMSFSDSNNILKALVEYCCSTNRSLSQKDQRGRTPLFLALATRNEKAVRLLLEHGADPLDDFSTDYNSLFLLKRIPRYLEKTDASYSETIERLMIRKSIGRLYAILEPLTRSPEERKFYNEKKEGFKFVINSDILHNIIYWVVFDIQNKNFYKFLSKP